MEVKKEPNSEIMLYQSDNGQTEKEYLVKGYASNQKRLTEAKKKIEKIRASDKAFINKQRKLTIDKKCSSFSYKRGNYGNCI